MDFSIYSMDKYYRIITGTIRNSYAAVAAEIKPAISEKFYMINMTNRM